MNKRYHFFVHLNKSEGLNTHKYAQENANKLKFDHVDITAEISAKLELL